MEASRLASLEASAAAVTARVGHLDVYLQRRDAMFGECWSTTVVGRGDGPFMAKKSKSSRASPAGASLGQGLGRSFVRRGGAAYSQQVRRRMLSEQLGCSFSMTETCTFCRLLSFLLHASL